MAEPALIDLPGPLPPGPAADAGHPVLAFLQAYCAAVWQRDVAAFLALYHPALQVFDTWGPWCLQGLPAWQQMAQQWFDGLGEERVRVAVSDVRCGGDGGVRWGEATLRYTALSPQDHALRSLDNRLTVVLQPGADGRWQVVHAHSSLPVDGASGQPQYQR